MTKATIRNCDLQYLAFKCQNLAFSKPPFSEFEIDPWSYVNHLLKGSVESYAFDGIPVQTVAAEA